VKVKVWTVFILLVLAIFALRIYDSMTPPAPGRTGPRHGHK